MPPGKKLHNLLDLLRMYQLEYLALCQASHGTQHHFFFSNNHMHDIIALVSICCISYVLFFLFTSKYVLQTEFIKSDGCMNKKSSVFFKSQITPHPKLASLVQCVKQSKLQLYYRVKN